MGNEVPKEMDFWTKEEYLKFSEAMMDKPRSYYAFEMLYWCGIRSGELLALTPADFEFSETDGHNQARHFTDLKGGILSQARKTKKSTVQSKCRHFSVRKCRIYQNAV